MCGILSELHFDAYLSPNREETVLECEIISGTKDLREQLKYFAWQESWCSVLKPQQVVWSNKLMSLHLWVRLWTVGLLQEWKFIAEPMQHSCFWPGFTIIRPFWGTKTSKCGLNSVLKVWPKLKLFWIQHTTRFKMGGHQECKIIYLFTKSDFPRH